MRRQKIHVYSRPVRYIQKEITLPNGQKQFVVVGDEKGIDVRIALDTIRLAHKKVYDVALDAKPYCDNKYTQLSGWKATLYDVIRSVEKTMNLLRVLLFLSTNYIEIGH